MGLDIDKCRVCDTHEEEAAELFLFSSDDNISKLALFAHFRDFVYEAEREVYDVQKIREMHNLKEITNMCGGEWDYWEFRGIDVNGQVKEFDITFSEMPIYKEKGHALKYVTEGYQRKGMTAEFHANILHSHSENRDVEAEIFIFSNERLNVCKQFCLPNQPLLCWKLGKFDFIMFDY